MDGRVCVVTGATSGVGYQAVKRLAQGGAHCVIVCRNLGKGNNVKKEMEAAYKVRVDIIQADLGRLFDVRQAADRILQDYPHIDVLINNAGIHNTRRALTDDGIEAVFAVNHIASFLLTRLLLERIIASAPARIIQVSSQGHRFGGLDLDDLNWTRRRYKGLQGYGASKVAQLLAMREFHNMLAGTGVTINAIHPGEVKTNIGMNNGMLYRLYNRIFLGMFLKDASISGEAIYYIAAAPELDRTSGVFFNLTIPEVPARHALDSQMGKKVWVLSEQLAGL